MVKQECGKSLGLKRLVSPARPPSVSADTLMASNYTEASIKTLSSLEHIRLRPGMYIGRLGNGAHAEDGIYVLLKETIDRSEERRVGKECRSRWSPYH